MSVLCSKFASKCYTSSRLYRKNPFTWTQAAAGATAGKRSHGWQHSKSLCRASAAELARSATAELAHAAWGWQDPQTTGWARGGCSRAGHGQAVESFRSAFWFAFSLIAASYWNWFLKTKLFLQEVKEELLRFVAPSCEVSIPGLWAGLSAVFFIRAISELWNSVGFFSYKICKRKYFSTWFWCTS